MVVSATIAARGAQSTMRCRVSTRLAVAVLLGMTALAAFPMAALAHWTDVPFPQEAYSRVPMKGVKGGYSVTGVEKVVKDASGDIWAITGANYDDADSVYRLRAGATAWERADSGIPMKSEIVKGYWDIAAYGDEVYVSCTAGIFRRKVSDSAWSRTKGSGLDMRSQFVEFDGAPWVFDQDGVRAMRYDSGSTTWVEVMSGLPKLAGETEQGHLVGAANAGYLYAGLSGGFESVPDYRTFSVYRLPRGSTRWENTGLRLAAPDVWDATKNYTTGGVEGVWALDGYAFAVGEDGGEQRDFAYDERTGAWKAVPKAPGAYGSSLYRVDSQWRSPSNKVLTVPQECDPIARTITLATYDPRAGTWTSSIERAYTWAPYMLVETSLDGEYIIYPPDAGFTSSVPLPTQVSRDPKVIGTNVLLALFFASGFGLTSAMFNNTLKGSYATIRTMTEPISSALRAVGGRLSVIAAPLISRLPERDSAGGRWRKVVEPLTIIAGTALVYCFLDPGFAFSASGLGLFLSMGIAVSAVTLSYEGLECRVCNKRYQAPAALKVHPAALGIAVVCVLLSRAMYFHPGYVYGMVGGLTFIGATEPESRRMGKLVLASSLVLLGVSLAAWLLMVPATAWANGGGFAADLMLGTLAGVFVMGLEGLLFGLLPIRFMDGETVWAWNRWAWLGLFAAVAFSFWHVLLNRGSTYLQSLSNKNVQLMIGMLLVYAIVTVGMWLWFGRRSEATALPSESAEPVRTHATATPDAAWCPDPTGRHCYRYWDGQAWTASVADNGLIGVDPL